MNARTAFSRLTPQRQYVHNGSRLQAPRCQNVNGSNSTPVEYKHQSALAPSRPAEGNRITAVALNNKPAGRRRRVCATLSRPANHVSIARCAGAREYGEAVGR